MLFSCWKKMQMSWMFQQPQSKPQRYSKGQRCIFMLVYVSHDVASEISFWRDLSTFLNVRVIKQAQQKSWDNFLSTTHHEFLAHHFYEQSATEHYSKSFQANKNWTKNTESKLQKQPNTQQRFTIDLLPGEYNKTCTNRKIADTLKTELVVQTPKENDNPHDPTHHNAAKLRRKYTRKNDQYKTNNRTRRKKWRQIAIHLPSGLGRARHIGHSILPNSNKLHSYKI